MITDAKHGTGTGDKLAALWEYWRSRAGGRSLPSRRDIDPVDMPRHLATTMLVDGCGGVARRYRFRLVGTGLTQLLLRDPTTRYLDEVLDEAEMVAIKGVFGMVACDGAPTWVSGRLVWGNGWSLPADWLFLPLASDGLTVDMILGYAELPVVPLYRPAGRPKLTFTKVIAGDPNPLGLVSDANCSWFPTARPGPVGLALPAS